MVKSGEIDPQSLPTDMAFMINMAIDIDDRKAMIAICTLINLVTLENVKWAPNLTEALHENLPNVTNQNILIRLLELCHNLAMKEVPIDAFFYDLLPRLDADKVNTTVVMGIINAWPGLEWVEEIIETVLLTRPLNKEDKSRLLQYLTRRLSEDEPYVPSDKIFSHCLFYMKTHPIDTCTMIQQYLYVANDHQQEILQAFEEELPKMLQKQDQN